jgi:hypothetical protein
MRGIIHFAAFFFKFFKQNPMTELKIVEDNKFFTAGINRTKSGYVPFFQSHETEDDFEEELPCETEDLAFLRLAEIIIHELDKASEESEERENEEDVNISKVGDNPYYTQIAEEEEEEEE